MNPRFRSLLLVSVWLPLAGCDKPSPPPVSAAPVPVPNTAETEEQLAEARDALQRQALEIETKTALMDKQLADMEKALKDRENAELRGSLDALKQQNDALRGQADEARRQSDAITRRITATPQPVLPPSDYSLFYERLAPFGRWFDVSGYGYCWRPTITTAGWRPYLDGCWVWSSLGWAWQSNEPFGWATYHYGRWLNLAGYGWVWVPGSEWAPAWVAWRQSRDCVGWAPLPPEPGVCSGVYRDCDSRYGLGPTSYIFITTNHFVSPSYTGVCLPAPQRTTVFQNSVNVTQIVRRDDRAHPNVFVHHGGPPRAQVEQACARPVRQVQLQTTRADQALPPRRGQHREEALPQPVIVELPPARTHGPAVRPEKAEPIARPRRLDAMAGLPADVAAKVRQTIAEDKATASVQQPPVGVPPPAAVVESATAEPRMHERRRPGATVPPVHETVRSAVPVKERARAETVLTPAVTSQAAELPAPAVIVENRPVVAARADSSTTPLQATETQAPAASVESPPAATAETAPAVTKPEPPVHAMENRVSAPEVMQTTAATSPTVEPMKTELPVTAVVPVVEPEKAPEAPAAEVSVSMPVVAPPQTEVGAPQPTTAEKVADEQAAIARAVTEAEKIATEQAAAEAEKVRMQALAAQQQEALAAQQRAAAEQAQAAAMQQQQEQQRMAAEQAAATAAEAERARQQAESVMQRQQEEARRAAEEQQMRAQQEAAQRAAQEMALRESEEQARRQAEMERRAQEMAQRQAEEQARRAAEEQQLRQQQEMAQRRAEEEARRQAEHEMRRAQEMAQRQAEEARRAAEQQMRAQQEAAQRAAQEMVQRQAEEAARRAQEEAQRAAAEAARNQPPPQNPGQ